MYLAKLFFSSVFFRRLSNMFAAYVGSAFEVIFTSDACVKTEWIVSNQHKSNAKNVHFKVSAPRFMANVTIQASPVFCNIREM